MQGVTLLICVIILFLPTTLHAQNSGQLTASVFDNDNHDRPIIGAVVELKVLGSSPYSLYYTTDVEGSFSVPVLKYGDYALDISYLGYENSVVEFSLNTPHLELADIYLKQGVVEMEEVVKEVKALRASQRGDSLQYNASAFKVAADADVEGLLQKMPGITVDGGEVTAQGEVVKKIYIDGQEFFGDDVATALKSLPAEVVDKIELVNKASDDEEYSGVNSGNDQKVMNIVTKPTMREGIFGKLFGGVGYEPDPVEYGGTELKYMGGGSLNIFKGKSRTSVIALINNLNQQNFSFEDIMGATEEGRSTGEFKIKPLPGVANVNAVGVNYSNIIGEDKRLKLQGSYFFNQTTTYNTEELIRWYEEPATNTIDSLWQQGKSVTDNINNRLTGKIEYRIDDRQSFMIRPSLSFQTTAPSYSTIGTRYDNNEYPSYKDGEQHYSSSKSSSWGGYNLGTSANYRLRLNDKGRSVSLGGYFSANSYDTNAETTSNPNDPNPNNNPASYTYESAPTSRHSITGNFNYLEPISKYMKFNLSYKISNTFQESDKRTYDTAADFDIIDFNNTKTTDFAQSDYLSHSIGAGFNFYKYKFGYVAANVSYEAARFDVNTLRTKASSETEDSVNERKKYNNVTYSLSGKVGFNTENSLRFYVNGYTWMPPIGRFTDNTSSKSYVTAGNSDLNPTYSNRLRLYYTHTDIERGNTLMFNCNALISTNYIGSHVVLDPGPVDIAGTIYDELQQYTGWVNMNTYYKLDSNLSYGIPLDFLKSNLNFNAGVSYTLTPSRFGGKVIEMGKVEGGETVETESMTYKGGATLGSNISESVDFTLSWRGAYNDAANAFADKITENHYFNQTASANMKFVFGGGFTITGNVAYKQYLGITNNFEDQYVLCNAFIGHKLMKKNRGEIIFGVNDILNQNTSIARNIATSYTQNKTNAILGRYFSVQFIYNLRAFKKAK